PEILEGSRVGVAALLDPEILDPEHLAVAVGPQEVRPALVGRDDALVVDEGDDPLLLAPHAGAVREHVPAIAVVEQLHPGRRRAPPQGLEVVDHVEEVVAGGTAVDDLEQAVPPGATVDALEPSAVFAHDIHTLSPNVGPPYRPTGRWAGSTLALPASRGTVGRSYAVHCPSAHQRVDS